MKTVLLSCVLFVVLGTATVFSQQEEDKFGVDFSGFVKTDMFYDTRQTVNVREGHFSLYPANEAFDANDVDINESPSFNILSIQTRARAKMTGPKAFGAKSSAFTEAEFFGTSNADINGVRLRHAFVRLDWESSSLLVGQTWHPMFVTDVFPGTVSFNTGVPFQPFARNPQVRFTKSFGGLKVIAVAATQRDFQSIGPAPGGNPVSSSSYLRNSVIPMLHLQTQYKSGGNVVGAGVDYKELKPRLVTANNIKTDECVSSISAIGYAKVDLSPFTIKAEGVMGNNLADMLMLGGYGVNSYDEISGAETYTTLGSYSMWGEVIYGKELEVAVFAGYSENLGAQENLTGTYYSRGSNIHSVFRVSPRIQWNSGKTRISTELEYTSAAYGTPNSENKGLVEETTSVANTRILVAVYYFF